MLIWHGTGYTPEWAAQTTSLTRISSAVCTLLLALVLGRIGKRTYFAIVGCFLMNTVFVLFTFTSTSPPPLVVLLGVAQAMLDCVVYPSIAILGIYEVLSAVLTLLSSEIRFLKQIELTCCALIKLGSSSSPSVGGELPRLRVLSGSSVCVHLHVITRHSMQPLSQTHWLQVWKGDLGCLWEYEYHRTSSRELYSPYQSLAVKQILYFLVHHYWQNAWINALEFKYCNVTNFAILLLTKLKVAVPLLKNFRNTKSFYSSKHSIFLGMRSTSKKIPRKLCGCQNGWNQRRDSSIDLWSSYHWFYSCIGSQVLYLDACIAFSIWFARKAHFLDRDW